MIVRTMPSHGRHSMALSALRVNGHVGHSQRTIEMNPAAKDAQHERILKIWRGRVASPLSLPQELTQRLNLALIEAGLPDPNLPDSAPQSDGEKLHMQSDPL